MTVDVADRRGGLARRARRRTSHPRGQGRHADEGRDPEEESHALAPELRSRYVVPAMPSTKRVLFVCTGNTARSQIAEGLLRHISKGEVESFSAGTEPKEVNPLAVRVMSEAGVDISAHRSKSVAIYAGERFDFVITVCDRAKEKCPRWPSQVDYIHWSIDDPAAFEGSAEDRLKAFRKAREELRQRITLFLLANRIGSLPGSHAR